MEKKPNLVKNPKKETIGEKLKGVPKNLREIFLVLASEKIIKIERVVFRGDLEENVKHIIEDSFKSKYHELNERFSELRKAGIDLGVLNLKLMMIPLKLKVFLATYEKKDAENLLNRIKELEKEINKIKF